MSERAFDESLGWEVQGRNLICDGRGTLSIGRAARLPLGGRVTRKKRGSWQREMDEKRMSQEKETPQKGDRNSVIYMPLARTTNDTGERGREQELKKATEWKRNRTSSVDRSS
ncbi:hypothetical protein TNCV_2735581 [Trichonephila clavipes]|nr:hypothetical protein TNCV_2735581 [Trichonephila clavipes]